MTGPLLATDLVNLADSGQWTAEEARAILDRHGIRRSALSLTSSEQLRRWSSRLRSAFEPAEVDSRCAAINELLEAGTSRAYLTTHDQLRPHLHFFASDDDDVVARVQAVTAGGLAIFAVESEGRRLGVCVRSGCGTAFVDISRNGRRTYCSARCGNNDAVQRHREAAFKSRA